MTDHAQEAEDAGAWNQFVGAVRKEYGDISGDHMEEFQGNMQQAKGWLQEKYADAHDRLSDWFDDDDEE